MLVLLDDASKLSQYVAEVPEMAWNLIEVSEKPLTVIYPGAINLAQNLIAEDGSVGIGLPPTNFAGS